MVSGISDIGGGLKDTAIGLSGVPQKFYETVFDTVSTIAHTPTELAHSARDITSNATQISGDAKNMILDIKPLFFWCCDLICVGNV